MNTTGAAKDALRREMRAMRRALPDRELRSDRITEHLDHLTVVRDAATVMVFSTIVGEPDTSAIVDRCAARGQSVVLPEDEPDPRVPDVVLVPGLAFTRTGERLGQGGGWYDRFLPRVRPGCTAIGLAFDEQVVAELPTEPHDRRLDALVTDRGTWWSTSPAD